MRSINGKRTAPEKNSKKRIFPNNPALSGNRFLMRITYDKVLRLFLSPVLLMALALCSQAYDITEFPDTTKTAPPGEIHENVADKEHDRQDGGKDVAEDDKDKERPLDEEDQELAPYIDLTPDTIGISAVTSGMSRSLAVADMRIEVSINSRELYVFSGREKVATYPVAVGKPAWPTRSGNWAIYEVVWNPWWHPPDEEWAWYRAIMAPGDPDNPLGRAQLIYDAPRSIHGTMEPSSIGRAVSHGSIRVTNEVAMKLARQVMESTGIVYEEEWYEEVQRDRSRNVRIRLSERVPIRVYP